MNELMSVRDALMAWLSDGVTAASWWQIVIFTLLTTHVTIAAVTLFLHRAQAHRTLDLHPAVSHFFRFWLWLGTGMVTKEWVAIHRKHHAKCETKDDPHSPVAHGIRKVFFEGSELYRAEAKNQETLTKYGHHAPDDWIERNLYSRFTWQGVGLMMIVDLWLFGAVGLTVWAVQMVWIPIMAAGIINGFGHHSGYRNFESPDASTNVLPWGVIIGGEELHNNHHTYPTSAKFSVKPFEFDLGWLYISILQSLGLATVRKTPPKLALGSVKAVADGKTLEAVIANRYEVMARYATGLRETVSAELARLKAQGERNSGRLNRLRLARTRLHRDDEQIPQGLKANLANMLADSPTLAKMVAMREELRQLWTRTNASPAQLVADLQAWCRKAEDSGIAMLQEFSLKLRAVQAQTA